MKLFFSALLLSFFFLGKYSLAQDDFSFSAQIRPRLEIDGRSFNNNIKSQTFTLLRSRVGFRFTPNEDLTAFFQVQDSRTFGQESGTLADTRNLDIHQAYFKLKNIFGLPLDIKIGRMEIKYGSERLIGAVDWSNVGRSFDGGILTFKNKSVDIDLLAMQEVEKFNPGEMGDQFILGLNADVKVSNKYKIQPFIYWQRAVPMQKLNRFTPGIYINGDVGNLFHEIEFAYQIGDYATGPDSALNKYDVKAFVAAVNIGYIFNMSEKPTLSAGADYLTGNNPEKSKEFGAFNTLYATNHKFYGEMDYFTDIPAHTYGLGLLDIHGSFSILPVKKLITVLAIHYFRSVQKYTLLAKSETNNFGIEGDLTIRYFYNDNFTLQGGASLFLPGDIFKEKRGKNNAFWFYIMTIVNL